MPMPEVDLQERLERNFPRTAARFPEALVKPTEKLMSFWQWIGYFRYLIIGGLMALIPIAMDKDLVPFLHGGQGKGVLILTGVWILLALGLSVVVGFAGLLDLGYVAFFMLGAYTTALMTDSGVTGQFHIVEWNFWWVAPFAVIVAMLAGVALGVPTLRLRGDYLAIVTLGFHEIVRNTANNLTITNGSRGIPGIPRPSLPWTGQFSPLEAELYWWYLLIPAILLAVIMIRHLDNSRIGRYWTAIREDEVAASAMGVPVVKLKVGAFAIGASTAGVGGWIYASYITFINPNSFPLLSSILVLCAVVIGGLGSIAGATLGAIIVITLPEIVREASGGSTVFGFDPETGRIAIFGLILIIVMIFRPGGLIAAKRRRAELEEAGAAEGVVGDIAAEIVYDEDVDPNATTVSEARIDQGDK